MSQSIFRSAVTGSDGAVDAGYLSLFWIMSVVITAIPFMCVFTAIAMYLDETHKFDVQSLGIGIGSVCTGFGVAVGAVGAFRMGDKRVAVAGTTTTTQKETIVQTEAAIPAPVAADVLMRGTPEKPLHVAVEDEAVPSKSARKQSTKSAKGA